MTLSNSLLQKIFSHCERLYPSEACGLLIGKNYPTELILCKNVQDNLHGKNPIWFSRTSRNAYLIDPQELLTIQKKCCREGKRIQMIFHSHTDGGAYFSKEDQKQALIDGEPTWPDVHYLVVSVMHGKAKEARLFRWRRLAFAAVEFL